MLTFYKGDTSHDQSNMKNCTILEWMWMYIADSDFTRRNCIV